MTLEIDFDFRLPQKQGRWGQWQGVTFLSNWLPVLAFYDESGWQPTPFIPWHQPFFNEAGIYNVRVTLPGDQTDRLHGGPSWPSRIWATAASRSTSCPTMRARLRLPVQRPLPGVRRPGRPGAASHCLSAFPEHEFYAREMVRIACEAIPVYSHGSGPIPTRDFTIAESYFGWNGNECGGLVMIDERIFGMPHVAGGFVDYLISHEICHQWWYNVVGTNGYCETWMDEAPGHLLQPPPARPEARPQQRAPELSAAAWNGCPTSTARPIATTACTAPSAAAKPRPDRPGRCPSSATSSTCSACATTGAARSSA